MPKRPHPVPIPLLSDWEGHMAAFGTTICNQLNALKDGDPGPALAETYYDATRVFYQIANYTSDAAWQDCAQTARYIYRDRYVIPNDGNVPGYWLFTTGLRLDYEKTGDQVSKDTALLLSNRMYAKDSTPLDWTVGINRSREVAYAILSYIDTLALGGPARARRVDLVNQAYGHLDQWFVTKAWQGTAEQFSPFMVALTAHSLIRDWEQTHDTRIIPALRSAADYLWADAWIATDQSMRYQLNPASPEGGGRSTIGAPDLNLLIAPMYAWLWLLTADPKYRDQGDAIFAGGVSRAYLGNGKHFDQNYWWSFDYVAWRKARA